jgi:hypothetical protein
MMRGRVEIPDELSPMSALCDGDPGACENHAWPPQTSRGRVARIYRIILSFGQGPDPFEQRIRDVHALIPRRPFQAIPAHTRKAHAFVFQHLRDQRLHPFQVHGTTRKGLPDR